jgi:heme exporter protein D
VTAELQRFLAMGGYAAFVWPAYADALFVLGALFGWSLKGYRRRQHELAGLERAER